MAAAMAAAEALVEETSHLPRLLDDDCVGKRIHVAASGVQIENEEAACAKLQLLSGEEVVVPVPAGSSISVLRRAVAAARGVSSSQVRLLHGTDEVSDAEVVQADVTLQCVLRRERRRDVAAFVQRTDEQVEALVEQWMQKAHDRATLFFESRDGLREFLSKLARCIDAHEDPILGDGDECSYWYGAEEHHASGTNQPVLSLARPGEAMDSLIYVNRILAFIFLSDEQFEQMLSLPKQPLAMRCGEQLCVCVAHILARVYVKPAGHSFET